MPGSGQVKRKRWIGTIILPFSQLGGLHGAQRSRSSDLKRFVEDLVTTAEFAKRRCDAHGR
jgi:hypothetical protein